MTAASHVMLAVRKQGTMNAYSPHFRFKVSVQKLFLPTVKIDLPTSINATKITSPIGMPRATS